MKKIITHYHIPTKKSLIESLGRHVSPSEKLSTILLNYISSIQKEVNNEKEKILRAENKIEKIRKTLNVAKEVLEEKYPALVRTLGNRIFKNL